MTTFAVQSRKESILASSFLQSSLIFTYNRRSKLPFEAAPAASLACCRARSKSTLAGLLSSVLPSTVRNLSPPLFLAISRRSSWLATS